MNTEKFLFTACGGTKLSAVVWTPDNPPKMILQIAHGMTEHIGRYDKLAEDLTAEGIAVAGFDMRGHGQNPGDAHIASFGEGGWKKALKDMHLFYAELENRWAGIPHFMLGFSLGSFMLREYLNMYDDKIAGAVILGTGHQPALLLTVMCAIVKTQIKKSGFDGTTPLIQALSFGAYNRKFAPNKTPSDWLCADEIQREIYIKDPLCREHISSGLFEELLCAMKRTGNAHAHKNIRKDMPVLLLSGQDDPVGDFGKGVLRVDAAMRKADMKNVQTKLFPGARHSLLHEEASGNAEEARKMISDWMKKCISAG